ncbi:hypothetical protein R3P38DRAFT_2799104 [Favolaschia claudopus]|uniref:F-box domain-containing protein n=1 Tax=Favolaschia claudopus TaxID=2862362 RepID=A0AAW0A198_9AGAR
MAPSSTNLTGTVFPPEVLMYILLLACGCFAVQPARFCDRRRTFSQVTSYWRSQVIGDVNFWNVIFVAAGTTTDELANAIERSQASRVHVYIDPMSRSRGLPFRRSWRVAFEAIARILEETMERCYRCTVNTNHQEVDPVVTWLADLKVENIEMLDLRLAPGSLFCSVYDEVAPWDSFEPRPSRYPPLSFLPHCTLTFLSLRHSFMFFNHALLCSITRLRLGPILEILHVVWDDISTLLRACTALTFLFLDDVRCSEPGPFTPCPLPFVTHLKVFAVHWTLETVLSALQLPSLRVLDFEAVDTEPTNAYFPVALHACAEKWVNVEHLALSIDIPFVELLNEALGSFHALRHLDLRSSTEATVWALGRLQPPEGSTLCCYLRTIHVSAHLRQDQINNVLAERVEGHFSSQCVLSCGFKDAGDGSRRRLSYRCNGKIVEAMEYVEPIDSGMDSEDTFCMAA